MMAEFTQTPYPYHGRRTGQADQAENPCCRGLAKPALAIPNYRETPRGSERRLAQLGAKICSDKIPRYKYVGALAQVKSSEQTSEQLGAPDTPRSQPWGGSLEVAPRAAPRLRSSKIGAPALAQYGRTDVRENYS
jgi:hypothetical protein